MQASDLATKANDSVDDALTAVNNITSNVTTTQGDTYSYVYTLANITGLDPSAYPYNETTQAYLDNLKNAQQIFSDAVQHQVT